VPRQFNGAAQYPTDHDQAGLKSVSKEAARPANDLRTWTDVGPAVAYGLRPEDLSLVESGLNEAGVAEALIPGRFTIIEPTGPETYATLQTPVGALTVRVPGALRTSVGEAVWLRWQPEQAHVFDAQSGLRLAQGPPFGVTGVLGRESLPNGIVA